MELHSYAKRRIQKKWTMEQKRKLVEARIAHDAWFANKPTSVMPWKNVLLAANLDDFNVFFVRKQWSNMLTRYKQYKQTCLDSNIGSKAIDTELIKRINQEWEFFEAIHTFMTRKTTNLHSYALTYRSENNNSDQQEAGEITKASIIEQECHHQHCHQTNKTPTILLNNETITINSPKDCIKENIPNNASVAIKSNNISSDDGVHLFSSDTSNEFQGTGVTTRLINGCKEHQSAEDKDDEKMTCVRNTDHDFYSKRSSLGNIATAKCYEEDELQEQQSNYFADASEESQGSLNMVNLLQTINTTEVVNPSNEKTANDSICPDIKIKSENKTYCASESLDIKEEISHQEFCSDMPSTSTQSNLTQNITTPQIFSKLRLSERDKYYRHKRRFNRRLEKRFDAFLQVMGQIVETEYPSVDVTPLKNTITLMTAGTHKVLSSDSDDDESGDNNTNILKTTLVNK